MNSIQVKIVDLLRLENMGVDQIEDLLEAIDYKLDLMADLPVPKDKDEDEWFRDLFLTISVLRFIKEMAKKEISRFS